MALIARNTADPQADLTRTWCYQPHEAAMQVLPERVMNTEEIIAEAEQALADAKEAGDAYMLRLARQVLEDAEALEWTGACWSVRAEGIPGIEITGDETDEELIEIMDCTTLSPNPGAVLAVFEGEIVGDEHEANVTNANAVRFLPQRLVRVVHTW